VAEYCRSRSYLAITPVFADPGSVYHKEYTLKISDFSRLIAMPGQPHEVTPVEKVAGTKIDSVFVGSCTNGRMEDMRAAAGLLKGRKVAPGVVLKIVPATDEIWNNCLKEGLMGIFKAAGALVSNAGCAGCASGQVGQNGPGEKTVSTGNRNFEGKQGKGEVYLASVSTAVASAIAGHITTDDQIPAHPSVFTGKSDKSGSGLHKSGKSPSKTSSSLPDQASHQPKSLILEGKVWLIRQDNIDTDMIYHNRYLAVTDLREMGQYALGNLKGWEDFARKAEPGDMIIAGRNFGSGSSRQHAVDCFKALNTQAILAGSFGAIYERNAINAGFPVFTYDQLESLELRDRDVVVIDMMNGLITNKRNNRKADISKFSEVQRMIYE
jgi:aconitase A